MKAFIEQALYDRYNDVKENWGSEIHEKCIDELVSRVAEYWVREWDTAWTIIDNWLINWERGTYQDWWVYQMNNKEEDFWQDKFEEIEEDLENNWMFYCREIEEYCGY